MPCIDCQFKRIARFAPIIGLFIGCSQGLIWFFLSELGWDKIAVALITLALGIWITGGLHIDGLMDTADGLAAGPEKCLEAMKDSRVGAAGVQAMALIMLLQLAALIELEETTIIALPIACFWGRLSSILAIGNFKYINKGHGNSFHKIHWKGTFEELKPSLIIIISIILILSLVPLEIKGNVSIILGIGIGIIPAFLATQILGKKLGGHNGDSYGASVVLVETFTLLILTLIF